MKKLNMNKIFKDVQKTVIHRSPEILTGIGITGMLTTVILAVRATPDALKRMDAKKKEEKTQKLTKKEVVQVTWKCYVPAAVTATLSTACLVGASSVNSKRNTALAAAYTLSEKAMKEYRTKVVETIGEVKEKEINDQVIKDRIDKKPLSDVMVIGTGDIPCYDVQSDRYFYSTRNKLEKVENKLNRMMREEMYVSLNDYYYEVGGGLKGTPQGDEVGWRVDCNEIDLTFTTILKDDETPCLAVDFQVGPKTGYRNMY
jgi:hypothetical protein